ncbi:MAG: F0F1 ATP synthase subunit A, partial [Bacteroidaceae bacterium]
MKTNKYIVYLLTFIFSICLFPTQLTASTQQKEAEKIDVKEIVLGHIGDEYHWHITKVGETHLSIPLPIIVYSKQTGWNIFSSSHLTHSLGDKYNGFYIAQRGANKDKLCETIDGQEVRPIDISITKNVLQLWIVVFIMLGVFLSSAHWYKKKNVSADAPRGFVGFIELFVMMVNDDIIKAGIGEKYYRPYAPYLLTTFFFVFTSNLIGLIPIFPGGANLTGNI